MFAVHLKYKIHVIYQLMQTQKKGHLSIADLAFKQIYKFEILGNRMFKQIYMREYIFMSLS